MGDRTYAYFTFMDKDEGTVVDVFGSNFNSIREPYEHFEDIFEDVGQSLEFPGIWECAAYEMNYGGYSQIEELVSKGVMFYCGHASGGEYNAFQYVNGPNGFFEVMLTNDGCIIARVKDNGELYEGELENIRKYIAEVDEVKTIFARYSEKYAEYRGVEKGGSEDALQGSKTDTQEDNKA